MNLAYYIDHEHHESIPIVSLQCVYGTFINVSRKSEKPGILTTSLANWNAIGTDIRGGSCDRSVWSAK